MLITNYKRNGVSDNEILELLERAIDEFGGEVLINEPKVSRTGVRFTLRCVHSDSEHARRSASGRRTRSATWEVHRNVLRNLFTVYPFLTIVTGVITYKGSDHFERAHPGTYYHNVGSQICPQILGGL